VFALPITVATKRRWESAAVEGVTNAKGGETDTEIVPAGPVMMIIDVPLRVGSAALVAVTVTGFDGGTTVGARKSTLPGVGPVGATHGIVPGWQIWPRVVFPLGIPSTVQDTAVFGVLVTVGVNVIRWVMATEAPEGATVTLTALTIVTAADTVAAPATAWTVTGLFAGRFAGAVYCAALALVLTMVPSVALPPGIPFTSQAIAVVGDGQNEAVKICVALSATFAEAGEIEFVPEQTTVTLAFADFEVSATLVAVTFSIAGLGGCVGAV
jgi:hypothetical protein